MRELVYDFDRRLVTAVCLVLLFASAVQAQNHYRLGEPMTATWDAPDNHLEAFVTRYEWQMDTGDWTDTALPTTTTSYTFQIPQALLTIGQHTFSVRACNTLGCGDAASVTFIIDPAVPGAPRNLRLNGSQQAVNLQQAVEIAQAYAVIVFRRPLTASQLQYLAARYREPSLTVGGVLALMDAEYSRLGQ